MRSWWLTRKSTASSAGFWHQCEDREKAGLDGIPLVFAGPFSLSYLYDYPFQLLDPKWLFKNRDTVWDYVTFR